MPAQTLDQTFLSCGIIPQSSRTLMSRELMADWYTPSERHMGHREGETCAYWQRRMMSECEALMGFSSRSDELEKKVWRLRYTK